MRLRSVILSAAAIGVLLTGAGAAASAVEPTADVNDFDFSSWDASFEVGVDDRGRATLHATETRVAEFPDFDQNRGIVAGFPESYQGSSLHTRILSVRDENGDPVVYETEDDDGMLYVLTGNNDYVHGTTTYVIEYEMRDVILAATETKVDEFYWDLLPLDSSQDIGSFHAEIRFDEALAPHLTGNAACYQGYRGSTEQCTLIASGDTFTVSAHDLKARQGVTVAIALDAGTVTQPPARLPNSATDVLPFLLGGGAALFSVLVWIAKSVMIRSHRRGTGIVVAQYDVPDHMPPLLASAIIPRAKNALAAQIIHLAVRGMLRLEDTPDTRKKKQQPLLRRQGAPIPDPIDGRTLKALFGNDSPDAVLKMPKNSSSFAGRVQKLLKSIPGEAQERGYTTKARSTAACVIQIIALIAYAAMLALLIWGVIEGRASAILVFFAALVCGVFLIFTSAVAFSKHTVLTPVGTQWLEYLMGVREFIRVAEEDRLQMLQSYTGAERRSDGSVDTIHVYERLLPYAILFGQEKQWGPVLENAYAQSQRHADWIDSRDHDLATRMVLFSSATRTSSVYVSPSSGSSSSSGGSSGGGFSGGGGGGGFSGGR